ncbi:methyltransferase family protein [Paraferrimonas sedimenticola]|uniref:Methanethiol S-methyltransferase n=1 Tax=Paraferrimonas sedimenticola TaxID=375674 RepID=A0AA37W0M8_9GAMM|nr:methyltransferase [Paraferrimonas sedimenticola]GLP95232.1 hypothetical protein GCM10007895_05380 [Paraferrimonas sedimenticola]
MRWLVLCYGLVSYLVGFMGLASFMLFMGNWSFFPLAIDRPAVVSIETAIILNLVLIVLFGVQHTVMARSRFKSAFGKIFPMAIERPTYVWISGAFMLAFVFSWQSIDGYLWQVTNTTLVQSLVALQLVGWVVLLAATFEIDHWDLMGVKQALGFFRQKPFDPAPFSERFLYRLVRHPIQLGVLIGVWSTPTMGYGHLMLALCMTAYMFIGLHYEEKSLVKRFGDRYRDYQARVPKLIPFTKFGNKKSRHTPA